MSKKGRANRGGSSDERQRLAELLLSQKGLQRKGRGRIEPRPELSDFPLSQAQQRIWAVHNLDLTSPAYNTAFAVHLSGQLEVPLLEDALTQILERHQVLRANFLRDGETVVQRISPSAKVSTPVVRLTTHGTRPEPVQIESFLKEQVERPFSIESERLFRSFLLEISPQEHLLLMISHQLVCDIPSWSLLLAEMATLYQSNEESLPALEIQYADFAYWESQRSARQLESDLAYWQDLFEQPWVGLELPFANPGQAHGRQPSQQQTQLFPEASLRAVEELAQRQGMTLFTVLLAALAGFLGQLAEQRDVLVFCPAQGRDRPALEPLVGVFAKQLPLRLDVDSEQTFEQLLKRANESVLGAFSHQAPALSDIIELLNHGPNRPRRSPFQAMLVFLDERSQAEVGEGLKMATWPLGSQVTQFEMRFVIIARPVGLVVAMEYKRDLFQSETVERLLREFAIYLEQVVSSPGRPLLESRPESPAPGAESPLRASSVLSPMDTQWRAMAEVWEEVLGLSGIGPDDNFFALGGHSLQAVQLLEKLGQSHAGLLPEGLLFDYPTVAKLHQYLQSRVGPPVLVNMKEGSEKPLFLVPGGYGGLVGFLDFARCLPPQQPVIGLSFEGTAEADRCSLEAMATRYAREIREHYEPPYHLFGFSFGGLVVYEMALLLGDDMGELIVLDTYGPHCRRHRGSHLKDWMAKLWTYFRVFLMANSEELREILSSRWRRGSRRPEVTPQVLLFLKYFEKLEWCAYQRTVHLLRYTYQPRWLNDPTLGWSRVAPDLQIYDLLGTHGAMSLQKPVVLQTARTVARLLNAYSSRGL